MYDKDGNRILQTCNMDERTNEEIQHSIIERMKAERKDLEDALRIIATSSVPGLTMTDYVLWFRQTAKEALDKAGEL